MATAAIAAVAISYFYDEVLVILSFGKARALYTTMPNLNIPAAAARKTSCPRQ